MGSRNKTVWNRIIQSSGAAKISAKGLIIFQRVYGNNSMKVAFVKDNSWFSALAYASHVEKLWQASIWSVPFLSFVDWNSLT